VFVVGTFGSRISGTYPRHTDEGPQPIGKVVEPEPKTDGPWGIKRANRILAPRSHAIDA